MTTRAKVQSTEEMIRAVCPENPDWNIEMRGRDFAQLLTWMVRQMPKETQVPFVKGVVGYFSYMMGVGAYPSPLQAGKRARRSRKAVA
jgi:hypothetical protein